MRNDKDLPRELMLAMVPLFDVLNRTITLLERLTDRVEVLELEVMHRRPSPPCTPNAPPSADGAHRPIQT
jgi:hypothetical protein